MSSRTGCPFSCEDRHWFKLLDAAGFLSRLFEVVILQGSAVCVPCLFPLEYRLSWQHTSASGRKGGR